MKIIKDFTGGISYILKGSSYFLNNREFWKYVLIPFLANLCLLVFFFIFLAAYLGNITEFLSVKLGLSYREVSDTAWQTRGIVFFKNTGVFIFRIIVGTLSVIVSGILFFIISIIVASPFYDLLSERIEQKYTSQMVADVSMWQAMRSIPLVLLTEAKKMLFLIVIPLFLLFLNIIPVAGSMIYLITASAFASVTYGAGFVDYIQARKYEKFSKRLKFTQKNFFTLLGFGLPVFIPILNMLITPLMVTGGTLIYIDKSGDK